LNGVPNNYNFKIFFLFFCIRYLLLLYTYKVIFRNIININELQMPLYASTQFILIYVLNSLHNTFCSHFHMTKDKDRNKSILGTFLRIITEVFIAYN